jgi:hypothetical protein
MPTPNADEPLPATGETLSLGPQPPAGEPQTLPPVSSAEALAEVVRSG